jgi:hypothetical protein
MDGSPVISKSECQMPKARLETPVLFVGGDNTTRSTGKTHRRERAQKRRLM